MQAVVQLRGEIDMSAAQRDTLKMLNIHAINHCALVPDEDTYRGMIAKVNDFVAFGEPDLDTVEMLLSRRGRPQEARTAAVRTARQVRLQAPAGRSRRGR